MTKKRPKKNENIRRINRFKRAGLIVVEPKANELQIDLDGARSMHIYDRQLFLLKQNGRSITKGWTEKIRPSKSGGQRFHVVITMPNKIDDKTRVLFQACLGSDLKREILNLCRVINGGKYPIVFFEKEK